MLRSMTGFGSASAGPVSVEVRSLNHRHREVKVRLPREFASLEPRIIALVSERVDRGMVEVVLRHAENARSSKEISIDPALADQLVEALRDLKVRHGLSGGVTVEALTAVEGVVEVVERTVAAEEVAPSAERALEQAMKQMVEMRAEEGRRLESDLVGRLRGCEEMIGVIEKKAEGEVPAHMERLRSRIAVLMDEAEIDRQRLEMEIAVLADRSDVSEELTRLRSHVEQMLALVEKEEAPVGRRMGFMVQEIGREVNTIGSKSQSLEISRLVVDLKAELERIREQVQNIE